MTYTKTQYVDGVTPLNAKNFNKNEGALEQVSKDIDVLSSAITQVDSKVDGKANSNHTHSEYAATSALNNKVDKVSGKGLSTNDFTTVEKNKLASLQNADVTKTYVDTELGKKSDKTNTYTKSEVDNKIAEAQLGGDGGNIDLSGYATKDDLLTKAEKVHAHTEYASKSSEHTHDNKTALDKVTDAKMNSWDSKATGNHNHNSSYSPLGHRHDASEIDNLPSSGGSSTPVIDNLTSTSTTSALSANQGKVLKDEITVLSTNFDTRLDGKTFKYLTQSEYDALTDEEKNNPNIIYGITDSTNSGGSYDDTELRNLIKTKANSSDLTTLGDSYQEHIANHPSGENELSSPNGDKWIIKVSNEGALSVEKKTIPVGSVSLDKTTHVFKVNETVQLNTTVLPENATNKSVVWYTSDENKATVVNGLVTAMAEGSCIITVSTEDGLKTSKCNLTIIPNGNSSVIQDGLLLDFDSSLGGGNISEIPNKANSSQVFKLNSFDFNTDNGWTECGGLLFNDKPTLEAMDNGNVVVLGGENTKIRTIEIFGKVTDNSNNIGGIAHQHSPINFSRQMFKRSNDGYENFNIGEGISVHRKLNFPPYANKPNTDNGGYFYFSYTDSSMPSENSNSIASWTSLLFGGAANMGKLRNTIIYSIRVYNRVLMQEEIEHNYLIDINRFPEISN